MQRGTSVPAGDSSSRSRQGPRLRDGGYSSEKRQDHFKVIGWERAVYSHTVEQCSEPSGGRRCHQQLVTAGILVPLPAGEKEKGAVVRWRSIKREVNGLQVRPVRCGRRPATRYAQQLIRLLPVRGLPSACAGGDGWTP